MSFLVPRFPRGHLPVMIRVALLGAVVAGCYGAAHDQLSYTISPGYFTKVKFRQFSYADFGWPPRLFAAEVGFLATWWVGLLAGWFAARVGLAEVPAADRWRHTARTFGIVIAVALATGIVCACLGVIITRGGDSSELGELRAAGIDDPAAFLVVAYLHAGGYLGAVVGLVLAIVYVRRVVRRHAAVPADRA